MLANYLKHVVDNMYFFSTAAQENVLAYAKDLGGYIVVCMWLNVL